MSVQLTNLYRVLMRGEGVCAASACAPTWTEWVFWTSRDPGRGTRERDEIHRAVIEWLDRHGPASRSSPTST